MSGNFHPSARVTESTLQICWQWTALPCGQGTKRTEWQNDFFIEDARLQMNGTFADSRHSSTDVISTDHFCLILFGGNTRPTRDSDILNRSFGDSSLAVFRRK